MSGKSKGRDYRFITGAALTGELKRCGMSQNAAARAMGQPASFVNKLANGVAYLRAETLVECRKWGADPHRVLSDIIERADQE